MCPVYERENVHSTVGAGARPEAEHVRQRAAPPSALAPNIISRIFCILRDAKLSELELRIEGRQEITAIHNGDFNTHPLRIEALSA